VERVWGAPDGKVARGGQQGSDRGDGCRISEREDVVAVARREGPGQDDDV